MLDFRILGPLEVVTEAGHVRLGGLKRRATLAILLLNANRVVSVDRLADDLYAGAAPVTAVTQVQRQISDLRKLLGTAQTVETRAPGYVLRLTSEQLDLQRFERLTAEATRSLAAGEPQRAADLLREALALWRGPALADVAYESFAQPAIERLEEIRLAALEQRIDADLALGRHAELVGELEQLVDEYPLQERLCAQLMLALYRWPAIGGARRLPRYTQAARRAPRPGTDARAAAARASDPHSRRVAPGRSSGARPRKRRARRSRSRCRFGFGPARRLLSVAEPLALSSRRNSLSRACSRTSATSNRRRALRTCVVRRFASGAYRSLHDARSTGDVVRLTGTNDAGLVLMDGPVGLDVDRVPDALRALFERSPADVGVLSARGHERVAREYSFRSAAGSTTGQRSSLAHGSHLRAEPRCDCSERRRMHNAVVATLAGCSPTRRSLRSASSASTLAPCLQSQRRMVSWLRSRTRHSLLPASRRAGAARGSATPAARSCAGPTRRCCSSTAGHGRAASRRTRAARASAGRSRASAAYKARRDRESRIRPG